MRLSEHPSLGEAAYAADLLRISNVKLSRSPAWAASAWLSVPFQRAFLAPAAAVLLHLIFTLLKFAAGVRVLNRQDPNFGGRASVRAY